MADPISTTDLWGLAASPETLSEQADAWVQASREATDASETVDRAARKVFSDEAWLGDTADTYDRHREKVSRDLREFASIAESTARILEETAEMLRFNQDELDRARSSVSGVTVLDWPPGTLTFLPEDEEQGALVRSAIAAARDIRGRVDEMLAAQQREFQAASSDLAQLSGNWTPRSLRVLDMNVQQGGEGNKSLLDAYLEGADPRAGTDPVDIPSLGQMLIDEDVDVATLQETFEGDMENLARWLSEETGDNWELRFAEGTRTVHYDADGLPVEGGEQPFGTAVLVRMREGGNIDGYQDLQTTQLQADGDVEGRQMGGVRISLSDR